MVTRKVIDNQVYELHRFVEFRYSFYEIHNRQEPHDPHINNLVQEWLRDTEKGQWVHSRAIEVGWAEEQDFYSYDIKIKITGFLLPKYWTEYCLKFLDNATA